MYVVYYCIRSPGAISGDILQGSGGVRRCNGACQIDTDHVDVDTMHGSCSGSCEALNERERDIDSD